MTHNTRWLVALGVTALVCGALPIVNAQDDLEALLKDAGAKPKQAEAVANVEAAAPAAENAVDAAVAAVPEVAAEAAAVSDDAAALVSELMKLEEIRRKSLDDHGYAALRSGREALQSGDYDAAREQFKQALEFITKRPGTQQDREDAKKGLAEAYYLEAKQAMKKGDYESAVPLAAQARYYGQPQAERMLEALKREPPKVASDDSSIAHRINEKEYKSEREEIRRRLRRSRQYFTTAEYNKALEECELILREHPDHIEAINLRAHIAERMKSVADVEFEATRRMMIRDVRKTWTPERYAINSAQSAAGTGDLTSKEATRVTDTKTSEQIIQQKLRDIIIPEVTFRPPATVIDAVDFFKQNSVAFDKPEVPIEQRGVNLVLKLPTGAAAPADDSDPFAAPAAQAAGGVPTIPALSARFISLYDALKLVCDVTGMKFKITGNIVMIVPLNEPDSELMTRSYNVLPSLTERMSAAQSEMGSGGGDNTFMQTTDMGQKQDWKVFFEQMGVKWPDGTTISYLATIGKLRVTNTSEQLAIFEQVLEDLNVTPRLIEIEARFVEVSQSDLNSLGFEWLLNSDFSFDAGGMLDKALNMREFSNKRVPLYAADGVTPLVAADGVTPLYGYAPYTRPGSMDGIKGWIPGGDGPQPVGEGQHGLKAARSHNASINTVDGGDYSIGNRYLSTKGNPLIPEGEAINDRFMRVNAFLGNADLSMILHMLSQRSDSDLLSAPKVVTKSGQEAVMKVVTEYIYPTEFEVQQVNTSSGGSYGGSSTSVSVPFMVEPQNFEMREVGVILQVVPEVSAEGQMINLMLNPQVVSEPVWKNYGTKIPYSPQQPQFSLSGLTADAIEALGLNKSPETEYTELPMEQPFFHVRSVSTQLSVYNGATVVMGGMITEDRKTMEDKVPFLGDIPYLGRLFRSRSELSVKRNLLVFVTARLVDPSGRVVRTSGESALLTGAEKQESSTTDVGAVN